MPAVKLEKNPVETANFRSLMRTVCSPVTVVTTATEDGRPHGTTVGAFSSLSLEPPMILVALDRASRLLARARETNRVGVNFLGEAQHDVARRFATKDDDKFVGVEWAMRQGLPYIEGSPGWLAGWVTSFVEAGDHTLLLCVVTAVDSSDARPLIYGHGVFGTNSALLPSA